MSFRLIETLAETALTNAKIFSISPHSVFSAPLWLIHLLDNP
ncbi:hypothetical protein [Nostoc sp.]